MRVVLILWVVLGLAACGGSDDAAAPSATVAARPAPAISGTTLDGKRVSLDQFRGRPVLVNVWSSW